MTGKNIILASKSPRRQQLLKGLDLEFVVRTKEVEEVYPPGLPREEVALYLARLKAKAFEGDLSPDDILITADTIVCIDGQIIGKPSDEADAKRILGILSGKKHEVITGVCLCSTQNQKSFFVKTEVFFRTLKKDEIDYYLEHYRPYDKAGAYGVQEWIGYIGIEKIAGSYFNVMGLPVKELYEELSAFTAL